MGTFKKLTMTRFWEALPVSASGQSRDFRDARGTSVSPLMLTVIADVPDSVGPIPTASNRRIYCAATLSPAHEADVAFYPSCHRGVPRSFFSAAKRAVGGHQHWY